MIHSSLLLQDDNDFGDQKLFFTLNCQQFMILSCRGQYIIIRGMKTGVDFIETNMVNFTKIIRPETNNKSDPKRYKYTIQKSFVPQQKSSVSELHRPELESLKRIYKRLQDERQRAKALLAEGKITRQELQEDGRIKRQQPVSAPAPEERVTIDQSGQVRDEQGNILFLKNRTTELLINKKKDEEQQIRGLARKQKIKLHQRLGKSFLDRNLIVSSSKKRAKRAVLGLQFLEKGSYQPFEHQKEVKEEIEDLNDVFAEREDEVEAKIIRKRNKIALQFNRDIPKVEWWDAPLLNDRSYQQILGTTDESSIEDCLKAVAALRVEDIVNWGQVSGECFYQKVGVSEQEQRVVLPMYLTKEERKKLKRKRKHEKLLQKNDKIKLGLIEPDKPKLRVGNMAIVMKNQFILDPSKIEAEARKQTQERVNRHLQMNSTRKLTKTQKKDKAIRKLKRDSAKECRRAVFRVARLTDPTHIFKVNMNAKQLALNGFVVKPIGELPAFPTMVLVEGGLRAIKFYKNLMLNRIRWEIQPGNCCKLIWEGEIENSSAGKWRVHEVGDEVEAIRILTEKKFESLWQYISQ